MSPVRTRLPQPAPQPTSSQAIRWRLSPGVTVLLLTLAAVLLAAGSALALQAGLGVTAPWAALWGSVLGVAAMAVPALALALKWARPAGPARSDQPAPAAEGVGAVTPTPLFFQLAEREWARARRYGTGVALLLVDVDRYPRLCETRGSEAGAAVLADLLRNTAAHLRGADVLTQFAAGQMAVFLAQADATGALDVAERIRERAEKLDLAWAGQPLCITVSVGVAHLRPAHPHLSALIEDAKDALAAARQAGGNCVRATPLDPGRAGRAGSWRDDRRTPRRQPRP
ncbi:MAG: diguanylate cyclase [Rubrivivax sp.]|nr:diguanylate cyclase [Rubrivivax sp.]